MPEFSGFQRVKQRTIWPHEAQEFTPWLADNLSFLAKTLNMELEFEAREKDVGGVRADLVCRNKVDNSRIVIENQLEKSDHSHLGQVLTYAAGLQAATLVWIATEFRNPHRVTLNWHNEITPAHFKFFGVELRTWQYSTAVHFAEFSIVSKPENWTFIEDSLLYRIQI